MTSGLRQLELNLEYALEAAAEVPEEANVIHLWQQFEDKLAELPQREYLRVASDVIEQLATLCEAKANILWDDWQDEHNIDGPVMGEGAFSSLVRQTQEIDFSDLIERHYQVKAPIEYEEDTISAVDKASVLEWLDAMEAEAEDVDGQSLRAQALSVSHAENISDWIQALSKARIESPLRLTDVQAQLKMPLMEVWLAALLGGFKLEQRGCFYETNEVWISAEFVRIE
ncbi:MAG: hypothetical protein AAFQ63_15000 [Cyanobacteria bacterium J06621_11]